jgi:signal peptidase I
MAPTLLGAESASGSDYVIADRLSYRMGSPKRGDLIVFSTSEISGLNKYLPKNENEIFFVMRLIGFPSENITISENKILVDGVQLGAEDGVPTTIPYLTRDEINSAGTKKEVNFKVGSNEYFVLGDNSRNSLDSRFWGGVPKSSVYGKVTTIYYPFSRAGRIPLSHEKESSNQSEVSTPFAPASLTP